MAEVIHVLRPEAATFHPAVAAPQLVTMAGSGNVPVFGLFFDGATAESAFFAFRAVALPATGGDVSVDVTWLPNGSPTGNVMWGASLLAVTPETDANDLLTGETFATEQTVVDVNLGPPAYRLHRVTITIPQAATDSMAANDFVVLKLRRVAADVADTLTVDAVLTELAVRYTQAAA